MMKAVALFSGGLDSTLAIRMMLEQKVKVVALHFSSPFCTCNKKGCGFAAAKTSQELGVELITRFLGEEYLDIVRRPKYGYGKNLNPCIDCRILMLKKCKELMKKLQADFVVTGEVLGQRPKSQTRWAIDTIEREAGLKGLIVRPLSARLLTPTIPEEKGWIDRNKLLNFYGRTRRPQIKMAASFDIKDYCCPAGGCLLTMPEFARKVGDLLRHEEFNLKNVGLLKIGRHFRLGKNTKLVVGRNDEENERILSLAMEGDYLFMPKNTPGPAALGRGYFDNDLIESACQVVGRYCDRTEQSGIIVSCRRSPQQEERQMTVSGIEDDRLEALRI